MSGRLRRFLELVEEVVTGRSDRDLRDMRRAELAAAWAECLGRLDRDAVVLVAPAPVERLDQLSYAIVAEERRPSANLPDVDLDDWWDSFYGLDLELYVAMPMAVTYERAGELIAEPWSNAPGERRGLHLASLYVDDRVQGQGMGSRLVRELIARARLRCVDSISVSIAPRSSPPDASERLIAFYRRQGFQVEAAGRRGRLKLAEVE